MSCTWKLIAIHMTLTVVVSIPCYLGSMQSHWLTHSVDLIAVHFECWWRWLWPPSWSLCTHTPGDHQSLQPGGGHEYNIRHQSRETDTLQWLLCVCVCVVELTRMIDNTYTWYTVMTIYPTLTSPMPYLRLEVKDRHSSRLDNLLHSWNGCPIQMPFDLLMFYESLMQYVQFKLFSTDKVVGVAVNFSWVYCPCSICICIQHIGVAQNAWMWSESH